MLSRWSFFSLEITGSDRPEAVEIATALPGSCKRWMTVEAILRALSGGLSETVVMAVQLPLVARAIRLR